MQLLGVWRGLENAAAVSSGGTDADRGNERQERDKDQPAAKCLRNGGIVWFTGREPSLHSTRCFCASCGPNGILREARVLPVEPGIEHKHRSEDFRINATSSVAVGLHRSAHPSLVWRRPLTAPRRPSEKKPLPWPPEPYSFARPPGILSCAGRPVTSLACAPTIQPTMGSHSRAMVEPGSADKVPGSLRCRRFCGPSFLWRGLHRTRSERSYLF